MKSHTINMLSKLNISVLILIITFCRPSFYGNQLIIRRALINEKKSLTVWESTKRLLTTNFQHRRQFTIKSIKFDKKDEKI